MGKIHPADGLINRLLKQNSRPSSAADSHAGSTSSTSNQGLTEGQPHFSEQRLESHLLQLYRTNRASKDKKP